MIVVSYSGGIDSTTMLINTVEKYGSDDVVAVLCNTGLTAPESYSYAKRVAKLLGVELIKLYPEKSIYKLVEHKKIYPSYCHRYCTELLKQKPFHRWLCENVDDVDLVCIGIRKEESRRRFAAYSKYSEDARYPYRSIYKKAPSMLKDIEVSFPILNWKRTECIDKILDTVGELNPVYKFCNREGCVPCFLRPLKQWVIDYKQWYGKRRIDKFIKIGKKLEEQYPRSYGLQILPNVSLSELEAACKYQHTLGDCSV